MVRERNHLPFVPRVDLLCRDPDQARCPVSLSPDRARGRRSLGQAAVGTPFGRRIHALALYLKTNQLFSYQRLQGVFCDLFGLDISQGALMNMFKRSAPIFAARREDALVALRRAQVVACDETGMRIEGCSGYQWVFCAADAVVHTAAFSRAAQVVRDAMAGHQPDVWISDRYTAQQGHGLHHQTCLAHLDRKATFVEEHGTDLIGMRLKLWFDRAFGLARDIATLAASTVKRRRRALVRDLDAILGTATDCELAHELLGQIRRARDQLLTFCDFPGKVDATNNVSERALRPSVIQRKVTNGYRAKWAADAEADLRTTADTARLSGANPFNTIRGLSSNRTENLHKGYCHASSMPTALGSRNGRSSPRATMSGMVKAYRPSMLMCRHASGDRWATSSSRTS